MHHERRDIETTERLGAIAARHDRRRLAARADRAEAAFDRDPGHLTELVLVERRPADRTERLDRLIDRRRPGGGLAAKELADDPHRRLSDTTVAGRRHDRRQAANPIGVLDRHRLGDHAAHRHPHDVGAVDAECVEQTDRVGGHVGQHVVGLDRPPEQHRLGDLPGRRGRPRELGRQSAVTVVEPDHPKSALGDQIDELLRPIGQLTAEPHHEQQRFARTLLLVLDRDPVRLH